MLGLPAGSGGAVFTARRDDAAGAQVNVRICSGVTWLPPVSKLTVLGPASVGLLRVGEHIFSGLQRGQ